MKINKKKLISNIAFYLVLVIIYSIAIFAVVLKFNKETIYFFNKRIDIVLTDSMSVRNEHHADYLSDTTQIQPFDMVVSEEVKEDTEIKEKDCVLFYNPDLNNQLVVHRVVNIYEEGLFFTVDNASKTTFNNEDVFSLDLLSGVVTMDTLDYTSISITAYSPKEYSMYYIIMQGMKTVQTTCETTKASDNVYKHVITYTRDNHVPYKTYIRAATSEETYISSVTYDSGSHGVVTFNASELVMDESNHYKKVFDPYYLYEIRADKSATPDGTFERSVIKSKVTRVIPKLGHVFHFIQSIPGIIMFVGLTIVITIGSYFWNKNVNKKDDSGDSDAQNNPTEPKQK